MSVNLSGVTSSAPAPGIGLWVLAVVGYLLIVSQLDGAAATAFTAIIVLGALLHNQQVHAANGEAGATVFNSLSGS